MLRSIPLLLAMSCLFALPASAMNFLSLEFDEEKEELTFVVAYRGTHDQHDFTVVWEACRPRGDEEFQIFGKVIDSDPRDAAREEFKKVVKLDLKNFECRPARVSLGIYYNHVRTIDIPAKRAK